MGQGWPFAACPWTTLAANALQCGPKGERSE